MTTIGELERITQDRVVALFQTHLGYAYLGNLEDRENNGNIETEILHQYLLKRGYSKLLIIKAITSLPGQQPTRARVCTTSTKMYIPCCVMA